MSKEDEALKQETNLAVVHADELSVNTREEYGNAAEVLVGIQILRKKVVETFGPIKKKLDEAKKETLDQERSHLKPLDEARKIIEKKVLRFRKTEEVDRKKAITSGNASLVKAPPKAKGVSGRKKWVFTIVDDSKINPGFLIPDVKKIRSVVNAMGDDAIEVIGEGVSITQTETITVRTK
jgi:hypothetical protein